MKRRDRAVFSWVVAMCAAMGAAEACGQPAAPEGAGGTCQLTSDCSEGYVCITQTDGTRQCSNDLTSIQSTEEAGADATMPTGEAGEPEGDGTAPGTDSGAPSDDGSTPPPQDTGAPPPKDSGSPPADTGSPPPKDTGAPPQDTGSPPQDTGTPPADTGTE